MKVLNSVKPLPAPKFSPANTKLKKLQAVTGKRVYSFDILSGYACPFAKDCKAYAVPKEGTRYIQDAPGMKFRCFSASQETMYKDTFNLRGSNLSHVYGLTTQEIVNKIVVPKNAEVVRIHVAGDFFHKNYFDAWATIAYLNPKVVFYCYTKALPLLLDARLPSNFRVTMSRGGTHDFLIPQLKKAGFFEAVVVESEAEAQALGLPVDIDDFSAYANTGDFALVIHGLQPKGRKHA